MLSTGRAGIPVSSEFATKDDVFAFMGGFSPTEDAQFLCYEMDGVLVDRAGSERISSNWIDGRPEPAAEFVDHMRRAYPELYLKLSLDGDHRHVSSRRRGSVFTQLRRAGFDVNAV
jgi:hypothetical protein